MFIQVTWCPLESAEAAAHSVRIISAVAEIVDREGMFAGKNSGTV